MVDESNPNDPNGFEDDFLSADSEFLTADRMDDEGGDTSRPKANLKEIWKSNPSLKIFAIALAVAFVLVTYLVLGASGDDIPDSEKTSVVRPTAAVSEAPGTAELPPAYEEAVRQESAKRAEEAAQTGGSALPTPVARAAERIEAPVQVEEEDPLAEWRREAEARRVERQEDKKKEAAAAEAASMPQLPTQETPSLGIDQAGQLVPAQSQPAQPPLPVGPTPEQVAAIAQSLQGQVQSVLETQVPKGSVLVSMNITPTYDIEDYFPPKPTAKTALSTTPGTTGRSTGLPTEELPPLIMAGTIAYGQTLLEANSDVPGPVLVEVASGPLIGGRAIGTFQVTSKYLVLQFTRIIKDNVEYPVQAIALDPGTTLPGMASKVDNHYFRRVFLPAAADFITGFAEAATRTDTTTVVTNGTVVTNNTNDLNAKQELLQGVNTGAQRLGQFVQQNANIQRTVMLHAGTRIGILFMDNVYNPDDLAANQAASQQQQQPPSIGQAVFNATPAGQIYNAYNAYNAGQPQQQGQQQPLYTNNTQPQQGVAPQNQVIPGTFSSAPAVATGTPQKP